jgi:hypothetical protein
VSILRACSHSYAKAAAEAWTSAFPTKEKQKAAATAVSSELLAGLCDAACITAAAAVERGMCEQAVAEELVERSMFCISITISTHTNAATNVLYHVLPLDLPHPCLMIAQAQRAL